MRACGSARSSRSNSAMWICRRAVSPCSDPTGWVTSPCRRRTVTSTADDAATDDRAQSGAASAIGAGVVLARGIAHHARSRDRGRSRCTARGRLAGAGRAHPAGHVLLAPGDERCARAGPSGAGRRGGPVDDAALHAPEAGGNGRRDPIAERTTVRRRTRARRRRYFGHGTTPGTT